MLENETLKWIVRNDEHDVVRIRGNKNYRNALK